MYVKSVRATISAGKNSTKSSNTGNTQRKWSKYKQTIKVLTYHVSHTILFVDVQIDQVLQDVQVDQVNLRYSVSNFWFDTSV